GFQRTGDQFWALGDARARGFLIGATAGRTTLHGEGLQHDDGHSHVLASTIPSLRQYDPAFAFELAAIVRDGIERMYVNGEGVYRFAPAPKLKADAPTIRLVGSGSILLQVIEAQKLLAERFGVAAAVYSAPSFPLLRRDALQADRWNRLHPTAKPRSPYVSTV